MSGKQQTASVSCRVVKEMRVKSALMCVMRGNSITERDVSSSGRSLEEVRTSEGRGIPCRENMKPKKVAGRLPVRGPAP